jgi:predicted metal-binding membrane protein
MSSATLRRSPPSGATDVPALAVLLALAATAWAVTAVRMEGMDAGPGSDLGELGWFMVVWVTMTVAMMVPAAAPSVLALPRVAMAPRLAIYFVAWAAAGFLGYVIVEVVRSLDLGLLAWEDAGGYLAGSVILAAGVYQLTPIKNRFLRRCREPMGTEYGPLCVGSSWALMAALFALGVMSVGWMALIAALIAAERLLPWRTAAMKGAAVLLVALGLAVALVPDDVPGLTIPGESHDMPRMDPMNGMEMMDR